eukprot:3672535-Pyramimonas_sp.AAC.1
MDVRDLRWVHAAQGLRAVDDGLDLVLDGPGRAPEAFPVGFRQHALDEEVRLHDRRRRSAARPMGARARVHQADKLLDGEAGGRATR